MAVVLLLPLGLASHPTVDRCDGEKSTRAGGCVCPADSLRWSARSPETGTHYVVLDELVSGGYLFSLWIYRESNGRDGLQRHDDYCTDRLDYTDGDRDEIVW